MNRPSLPVTPFGVNLTDPMLNFGWSVTFTPAAGLPLNSTVPDTGTVRGAEMPRPAPDRRRAYEGDEHDAASRSPITSPPLRLPSAL